MPNWTTTPPKDDHNATMRIIRTPPGKPLTGVVTTTDPIGTYTHFVANRTIPCEAPNTCPHCQAGYPSRWHGYLTMVLVDTLEHVIFEYTAAASTPIETYLRLNGTIRGAKLTAKRATNAPNSRVIITMQPTNPTTTRLPDPPNLKAHLCRIWNIKDDGQPPVNRTQNLAKVLPIPQDPNDGRYR